MILKKFFGKTIDVAKKSARQMYGDDIVVLESFHPEGDKEAGVTVLVDTPPAREKKGVPKEKRSGTDTPFRNVFYKRRDAMVQHDTHDTERRRTLGDPDSVPENKERSDSNRSSPNSNHEKPAPYGQVSRNLQALRDFAAREDRSGTTSAGSSRNGTSAADATAGRLRGGNQRFQNGWNPSDTGESNGNTADPTGKTRFKAGALGGRFTNAIRNGEQTGSGNLNSHETGETTGAEPTSSQPATRFEPSAAMYGPPSPSYAAEAAAGQQREVTALHKRFDKLESLLDSALISSNLDYASHPAFQQLIRTGIKPTVIARWFRQIIESGIDPDEEPQLFLAGLSDIIRKALKSPSDRPLSRHMLFTGPSGSGKTSLLMKLIQHPEFIADKQVAVVSVLPDKKNQPYYTVLEPFCRDRSIPYHQLDTATDVNDALETWKPYDHILIDTPAIPVAQERAFREYWKIRQMLAAATPLEVHYVINASLNRYYFRDSGSMHHPLQPDYVALTHLDEVSQWGPVIPFMEEMGCGARFMSLGTGIPEGLREFSPAWFTQQVLKDT